MTRRSFYLTMQKWSRVVTRWSFVFGAIYAGIQWYSSKVDARTKQTIDFLERFESDPFTKYWRSMKEFAETNQNQLEAKTTAAAYSDSVLSEIANAKIAANLDMISDFFDEVNVCMDKALCDKDSAVALFGPKAYFFYVNFFPYIDSSRKQHGDKNYGVGAETLTKTPRTMPNFFQRIIAYLL